MPGGGNGWKFRWFTRFMMVFSLAMTLHAILDFIPSVAISAIGVGGGAPETGIEIGNGFDLCIGTPVVQNVTTPATVAQDLICSSTAVQCNNNVYVAYETERAVTGSIASIQYYNQMFTMIAFRKRKEFFQKFILKITCFFLIYKPQSFNHFKF